MSDAAELVKVIKRTAMEAVEKGKPVNILFGKVVSADPLRINVEQRMELGRSQLILGRNVTDYETEVTVFTGLRGKGRLRCITGWQPGMR